MIDLKQLKRSFKHSTHGIKEAFHAEQSFRIQILAAIIVLALIFILRIKPTDAAILVLVSIIVLVLELVNSIFERLVDIVEPKLHRAVADIKDIMAATVLIASIGAIIVGLIIIVPYLLAI